ncbi:MULTISPECIES: sensor histidine kinase [Rubrivivax]|uniref:histidine kinase n=2 Tax=Rubrivivax benzoatilyticus TaxID=316997 RepID=A0ABX0I2P3_9BURK|nr:MULTISPECIES: ATP-binding protein [Rubrivivax]NHK99864.1 two-component sensor histidine kinase [Rubrivivax benzoatilyticus]NHL25857.1 two-component sensor histidine kinase [Rubrivivax benzoatilyticus]
MLVTRHRLRHAGSALALRLAGIAGLLSMTGCTGGGDRGALFGGLALVGVGAAAYTLGGLRERQAAQAALRGARAARREAESLLDGWVWRSDASHRLVALQPPAGSSVGGPAAGGPLCEQFETSHPEADGDLGARLATQRAFRALRVRLRADGSAWRLRGAPSFDELGRFDGFSGTAEPVAAQDALAADHAALQAVLQAVDVPALLAAGDGRADGWALRALNPAARRWLERDAPAWGEVLARLPAAVREALAASAPGSATEVDGWVLRRCDIEAEAGLLVMQAARAGEEGDGAAFSFTVSHDLRAPIRVVEGFTRILKEDYGRQLDRLGNEHLDRVLGAAARMNHMIDSMLALAKLSQQPLARQPVDLSQLAAWVVDDLRRQSPPERRVEVEIEPGLATRGDPTLLRLVLENLLGNAWKYSARNPKARIVFASQPHEGRVSYYVRDNGAGFDMRSADRLFGLFQRLHSASEFPGSGVGLASVRRIVRRHGGEVWAEAEPGRGATFHFTLRD